MYDEERILHILKEQDKEYLQFYDNKIKERYKVVYEKYPNITNSWKYYQEFERMCEGIRSDEEKNIAIKDSLK